MSLMNALSPASVPNGNSGLLDLLLGSSNPVSQFADSRQNVLGALGAGLASGPTFAQGLANAAQNIPAARQRDYQLGLYKGQVSQTVAYLAKKHPELASMVQAGTISPSDAFNQAFQLDNQQGVALAPGASLINPRTGATMGDNIANQPGISLAPGATLVNPHTGAQMGGNTGNGGFFSTDLKSQAWNVVMQANAPGADPALKASPKFQSAWAIATQPTMTPQGIVEPQIPPGWGPGQQSGGVPGMGAPPDASSAQPAMAAPANNGGWGQYASPATTQVAPGGAAPQATPTSASVSAMPMIAGPANAQLGHGIVPGTQPFNQSQSRTVMLTQSAVPDLKRVIDGFPALMNTKDQILSKFGDLGRVAQDPAYKQTSDAMTSAMGNILYVASGANLNAGELQRKVQSYMPSIGDDPQTSVNKLDRFANDVMTQANSTKDETTIQWAQQAVAGIKQTEQTMLKSSQPQTPAAGEPTATNQQTGQKVVLRNGQWVPLQ